MDIWIGVKKVTDLSVEEWETLIKDSLRQCVEQYGSFSKSLGLDLGHMLRFMPQEKLENTPNEIMKSHAREIGKALTNLVRRKEVIISGSTSDGHITFTFSPKEP